MTRPREGGHTIQHPGGHLTKALSNPNSTLFEKMQNQTTHRPQRETRRKTSWETSWETRRTGDTKGETKPREGGRTIQHRHTCGKTMGDKWRQDLGKGGAPSNTGTRVGRQWETRGNKTSGDKPLGKADAPSNTNAYCEETMGGKGRRGETRPREGVYAVQHRQTGQDPTQHRHTCGETMENIGRQGPRKGGRTIYNGQQRETRPSERWTHHPTRGNKKGHSIQQRGKRRDTIADKRRDKTLLGKVETPSNKGKQEGVQWETKGESNNGNKKEYNGRQKETSPSERRTGSSAQNTIWTSNFPETLLRFGVFKLHAKWICSAWEALRIYPLKVEISGRSWTRASTSSNSTRAPRIFTCRSSRPRTCRTGVPESSLHVPKSPVRYNRPCVGWSINLQGKTKKEATQPGDGVNISPMAQ